MDSTIERGLEETMIRDQIDSEKPTDINYVKRGEDNEKPDTIIEESTRKDEITQINEEQSYDYNDNEDVKVDVCRHKRKVKSSSSSPVDLTASSKTITENNDQYYHPLTNLSINVHTLTNSLETTSMHSSVNSETNRLTCANDGQRQLALMRYSRGQCADGSIENLNRSLIIVNSPIKNQTSTATTNDQVDRVISARADLMKEFGQNLQPFMVVVGEDWKSLTNFYACSVGNHKIHKQFNNEKEKLSTVKEFIDDDIYEFRNDEDNEVINYVEDVVQNKQVDEQKNKEKRTTLPEINNF
ncbi:hypothetical protein HCN44_000448 [Aphidius gifuensis]|uniref:Uncharacterized protein n=1 Tax=Aphidius gifuensis TaxID=684658 RepID=A0A834XNM8_APHGI|nr:hypothetical protein HCN44_000448 [Aphidius gifuensis]